MGDIAFDINKNVDLFTAADIGGGVEGDYTFQWETMDDVFVDPSEV